MNFAQFLNTLTIVAAVVGLLQFLIKKDVWSTGNKWFTLGIIILGVMVLQLLTGGISFNKETSSPEETSGEIVLNSPNQPAKSTPTIQDEPLPSIAPEPIVELVAQEYTGANKKAEYKITLEENEIIVGQSWGFSANKETGKNGGCIFLIVGSGDFTFSVTDGEWSRYKNVTTSEKADALLQVKIDYAKETYGYSNDFLKIFRLP